MTFLGNAVLLIYDKMFPGKDESLTNIRHLAKFFFDDGPTGALIF